MSFRSCGQNETLISSIRNIIKDYSPESIFKEFLQNADDAGATRFHIIVDDRTHPTDNLFCDQMKAWQGPAILIFNNAKFKVSDGESDFDSLMQIRVGGKQGDDTKIGKHGLGFNSCYHFTDVPSVISGDSIMFLDPLEKFLPKKDGKTQRGTIGPIPTDGIRRFLGRDQLVPFEGIEGINFRSTFNGTLFRIPLRQQNSDISDNIWTTSKILNLIKIIKTNFSSQLLFLRNVETIEISYKPYGIVSRQRSLWKASITGLDENERNKRKCVTNSIFRINIETINSVPNERQTDHWIIVTDSQQIPESLKDYAEQHRLRVSGGIAALLKSIRNRNNGENTSNFIGRIYSFFLSSEATHLPVHLNGTWAQGSDRGRLLIEDDDLPDLDHQKLDWNRHILLDFLPKLYCGLLKEIVRLRNSREIDLNEHPILKFWPFPPNTRNYPKYVIEYGCKVLQHMTQSENNFWFDSSDETNSVDSLFEFLPREKAVELRHLLRNNWDEIEIQFDENPDLKRLISSLPIWPTLSDPSQQDVESPLKPASCGNFLPKHFKHYRTNNNRIYLDVKDDLDRRIFTDIGVHSRDIYSYTFEDVDFPSECDYYYLIFLKSVLKDNRIVQGLRTKRAFPTITNKLKEISNLYDYKNEVFRVVYNGNSDMFLHLDLSEHAVTLSRIGFKNKVDQEILIKCTKKIEELQRMVEPPSDIRYRGFTLIDHFYKHIDNFEFESIRRTRFVPISKDLGKPYNLNYDRPKTLYCFDDIILSTYREVAWSQMSLIAEDVIPPQRVLQKYPSLGKPDASTVVEHLRFLYNLRNNNEWKSHWSETLKHNVYEVYKWLDEECSNDEDLKLSDWIFPNERLFLNFNEDQDPFNAKNWVPTTELVLNGEEDEEKFVNPILANYSTMLKSAGVREVIRPNVEIQVRERCINKSPVFEVLLDQEFPLNEIIFIVNGENIRTSRYMLAASYEFFRRKFTLGEGPIDPIIIEDVESDSVRILLRYLYGQSINDAIKSCDIDTDDTDQSSLYKDLLKLSNDYELDHLKELMELKLSRLVNRTNVGDMKRLAETFEASQLEEYCNHFINDNRGL